MRQWRHIPVLEKISSWAVLCAVAGIMASCGSSDEPAADTTFRLTGDPWVPNVQGAGGANHDSAVTISNSTQSLSGVPLIGVAQGWQGNETDVTIDMSQDLGAGGSLTLVATPTGFPSSALSGGAYPLLTYLSDGTNEYINLARANAGGDCSASGLYTCSGNSCSLNSACTIASGQPSAFFDLTHWHQHQITSSTFGSFTSTNTFPTCSWTGGVNVGGADSNKDNACAFTSTYFSGGKLRSGVSYTAKYVLMADSYTTLSSRTAGISVKVIKKTKAAATVGGGAIDVNVIFVGRSVSQASRNAKGKVNLDTLMTALQGYFTISTVNTKLGAINAFEWLDGEPYANVRTSGGNIGQMIAAASSVIPTSTEGKSVNVFLVNQFGDSASLLGIAGGIGGPPVHGLANSGVVFSTFGKLDQYNPSCSSAPCGLTQIESDFNTIQGTLAHEIGHYLGLNHPSESSGATHDVVRDTPICTSTDASIGNRISIGYCLNNDTNTLPTTAQRCNQVCTSYNTSTGTYCPTVQECQFNHMMYWSNKYFSVGAGTGDGNLFSTGSGVVINYNPLIQ